VIGERTSTSTLTNKTLTAPVLTAPVLGTPNSGTLTNCTDLPIVNGTTGTLSVARGGTGTATPSLVAGTGISITGSFPNQTVTSTVTGGVTSLNGQTGAITDTDVNAIGSYVAGTLSAANTVYSIGTTVSGSSIIQNSQSPFASWYSGSISVSRSGTYRAMNHSANGAIDCGGQPIKSPNLWVRIS
jgi:hypothetical protein